MIKLTLRKHPDDDDMVELIERTEIVYTGRPNRIRTTVWALVHCDAFHDDWEIRDAIKELDEFDIEINIKKP